MSDVNPGYAAFQIARALVTSEEHADAATRERAKERVAKWEAVLQSILTGSVDYGSRTPVQGAPAWATLEVLTGGFATGGMLAGGPLQEHERRRLADFPEVPRGEERRALNAWFLTDAGFARLQEMLRTGCYDVDLPEEGALLAAAWLAGNGYAAEARELLETISPFFPRLRFYPIPLERPRQHGSQVHLRDVGETIEELQGIGPNPRILTQKEAVEVWAPFHDRVVALFLETVEDGWPCRRYPEGWAGRALALLGEYAVLRKGHRLCGKPERANGHSAQLRELLGKCALERESLTGREVGRVRLILNRYIEKRGAPGSPTCVAARRRQAAEVSAPLHHEIAAVVVPRLEKYPKDEGLEDTGPLSGAVTPQEAIRTGVPAGTGIPPSLRRKVERCLSGTVEALVERGLITSGDTLARVLPQRTSGIRAAGIADPALRQLYAAVYRAFRRRRSLLLFFLQKQVQIEELPWVAAVERLRSEGPASRELARRILEEVTLLTLRAFPHAILPNKLLQELRALVKGAGLDIPLVDELAADIFMGELSEKFTESAKRAAGFLEGSLYATYYGIDCREVRKLTPKPKEKIARSFWRRSSGEDADEFVRLCAARAGVSLGTWSPATNGMILEQQQILTTQNLAALFAGLGLAETLRGELGEMARRCFSWVCRRHQMRVATWHANLIRLKSTAYAWRQMVFFLSLLPASEAASFLRWAEEHLGEQPADFQERFRPALTGLALAAGGQSPEGPAAERAGARRFLGWTSGRHWLLAGEERAPARI